jgi:hypothetical protein
MVATRANGWQEAPLSVHAVPGHSCTQLHALPGQSHSLIHVHVHNHDVYGKESFIVLVWMGKTFD